MSKKVDLYNSTYGNFQAQVLAEIRQEAFGEDIGQNSWITTDEYDRFYESLFSLRPNAWRCAGRRLLMSRNTPVEIACLKII